VPLFGVDFLTFGFAGLGGRELLLDEDGAALDWVPSLRSTSSSSSSPDAYRSVARGGGVFASEVLSLLSFVEPVEATESRRLGGVFALGAGLLGLRVAGLGRRASPLLLLLLPLPSLPGVDVALLSLSLPAPSPPAVGFEGRRFGGALEGAGLRDRARGRSSGAADSGAFAARGSELLSSAEGLGGIGGSLLASSALPPPLVPSSLSSASLVGSKRASRRLGGAFKEGAGLRERALFFFGALLGGLLSSADAIDEVSSLSLAPSSAPAGSAAAALLDEPGLRRRDTFLAPSAFWPDELGEETAAESPVASAPFKSSEETSEDAESRLLAAAALGRRPDGLGRRLPLVLTSPPALSSTPSRSSAETSEDAESRLLATAALGRRPDGLGRRLPLVLTSPSSDEVTDALSSSSSSLPPADETELPDPLRFATPADGRLEDGLGRLALLLLLLLLLLLEEAEAPLAICAFMRAINASFALLPPPDRLRPLRKPASWSAASLAAARAAAAT